MAQQAREDAGTEASPSWVRAPKQERARLSFERVLDAGALVLAQQGFEGFSVAEVCRLAAVSPGALYDRVASKDELFLAVHERELVRITASGAALFEDSARWRSRSTSTLILETFRALGRHYGDDAALLRAFILRAAVDRRVLAQGARANKALERLVVALLMTRAADYPHGDAEAAAHTAYRIAADAIGWRVGFGAEFTPGGIHESSPTFEAWVDQVALVCRTYLLTPPAKLNGDVDAVPAWLDPADSAG